MKCLAVWIAFLGIALGRAGAADSVVVFNEIMYHPATNESALEYVELHNQLAVDIDLSAWSLTGGIDFTFVEGTIIPGGGYLVVASNPAALQSSAGITNVLGPFRGRLDNAGEKLQLRDRNDRLMDEVDYRDRGKWPVAPDGSGASLAKPDPEAPSGAPERWASSLVVGGTPGQRNFPDAAPQTRTHSLVAFDALWRFEASGTDLGVAWRAPNYDDSGWGGRNNATLLSYWPFDGDASATRGVSGTLVGAVSAAPDRNNAPGGALAFVGTSQQYVSVPGGGGLNAAAGGTISLWVKWTGTQDADCCGSFGAVMARQANGQFSDDILALNNANPANAKVVWRQSGGPAPVLITGPTNVGTNWHHVAVTFSAAGSVLYLDGARQGAAVGAALNNNPGVPLSLGAWAADGTGFATARLDDVAIWDGLLTAAQIAQLAAQTKTPLDFAAPENAAYFAGDGRLSSNDGLRHTPLPLGPTTYYFRNVFQFAEDPARTALKLDLAVDDGVVFYLNGVELYRRNMPLGAVDYSTLAATAVGDAPFMSGLEVPAGALVAGTNVLAAEVHQATALDAGMVFGAGLTGVITPPGPTQGSEHFVPSDLVLNEVTGGGAMPFQVELFQRGTEPLDLGGFVLRQTGSADHEYVLAPQILAPGSFLVLDQATLGWGTATGDKLFLYRPGQSAVADAIEVLGQLRGRLPDGGEEWLFPSAATFGALNQFALHDEMVINEIMYHPPPTLEVPPLLATNALITISNVWKFDQSGNDLGSAWRMLHYDDSAWESGPALLFVSTATLPGPKNTPLTLGRTNYYFRATFLYTNSPPAVALNLRHIIDDGAVFYLNGVEVLRFNMPGGAIRSTNFAAASIGTAVFSPRTVISATNLLVGTNVLAVEVHQAASSGNDIVFGAELGATIELIPRVPYEESTEEWVELLNRSTQPVDLTGWRLDEGIDYRFANNTVVPAGGFLVVAKAPLALQARYPGIAVVGPYTNALSHIGERIVLKDASNNPADAVEYFDGGRWPSAADGGGSSLELQDPLADNAVGEAWAASDEGSRSSWQSYSYRGNAQASAVGPDGQWREFVIGLLDTGEVWLDDISVIETPNTTPVQLIQNGSFTTGLERWRFIGNHRHSEVIDDPDMPGNKVLRLVATGGTEHMSNHGETTLASGRDTVNGREYQISFRAKWVSGCRQFNTRLYFNRLARTTLLAAPAQHGTPGAANSTSTANLGPTYREFRHAPAVPAPFESVTVSALASDPQGVATLMLWHSVNGGAWTGLAMTDAGDGRFTGTILGKAAGTIVQFYLEGEDGLGAKSMFPAAGPNARALYKVNDGLAATNGLHNVRLVVRPDEANVLHNNINVMSNDKIGCTMIYDEREVFYDVGLRLKGSEHSRTTTPRLGFNVNLHSDHLFRGVHREMGIDRSESVGFGQREMLIHQTGNHAGGVPTKYSDLIQVMTPRPAHTGSAELQLARYGDLFLDGQFTNGSEGMVFEYELVYQLNPPTDNGTPEGNKVPNPDSVVGTPIRNLGDDKENYRWDFLIKNNEARDDYNRLIPFCRAMELTGTNFNAQIGNFIDVDQWLRAFALCTVSGAGDNYGGDGSQHNLQLYFRPSDQRVVFFPHDVDAFFDATRSLASTANGDLGKLMTVPANARAYYRHLRDIIATSYNGTYMARWAAHYGRLLPAQSFSAHLAFIVQRVNFINGQLNGLAPNVVFAITSNNGADFLVTSNSTTLQGNAATDIKDIYLDGAPGPLAVTWLTATSWRTATLIPLVLGTNLLRFTAYDYRGQPAGADSITVVSTATGGGLDTDGDGMPDRWELDNNLEATVANAMEDPDGDGLTNLDEFLAGTDPLNRQSALRLDAALSTNATVRLMFPAVAGRSYTVEYRESLGATDLWTRLTNAPPRVTNRVVQTLLPIPDGVTNRFYRLATP